MRTTRDEDKILHQPVIIKQTFKRAKHTWSINACFSVGKQVIQYFPAHLLRTAGISVWETHSPQAVGAAAVAEPASSPATFPTAVLIPPNFCMMPSFTGTHRPPTLASALDTSGHMVGLWLPHRYTPRMSMRVRGGSTVSRLLALRCCSACCVWG